MHIAREGFLDRRDLKKRHEYQEVLRFAEVAVEREDIYVMVICREGFTREAIETSLHNAGLSRIEGVATISELGKREIDCHAFLCIAPPEADDCSEEDLTHLENLRDRNWIVMSHSCPCPLFSRLLEIGANVSAVPFDISGRDLAHLACLAANRHRVLVNKFCETSLSFRPVCLDAAKLSAGQTRLLQQIARGESNKVIAKREGCSETKVKMQVRALLKKLDVANRTQAAVLAIRSGL